MGKYKLNEKGLRIAVKCVSCCNFDYARGGKEWCLDRKNYTDKQGSCEKWRMKEGLKYVGSNGDYGKVLKPEYIKWLTHEAMKEAFVVQDAKKIWTERHGSPYVEI